ncbi:hypothetical protein B0I33_10582 [Prauserella shujinwangii]|uniref:Uncharacterized protein n=1 Tax=Prauserella shujinwangii TaxID=1453103 RepID=A0A2T0LUK0_9PSEU|nr:hypothetical protein [Prauserella shujinwangii]PRX47504.1 hypothetical protein B0I33_10582 [Prauserella shujinwangii]
MSEDPEQLLAEALRAQARNAPPPRTAEQAAAAEQRVAEPPVVEPPHGYGLLSGAGEGSLERERAALEAEDTGRTPGSGAADTTATAAEGPLATRWVLLLAVLLGLASGALIGLLTLL